MRLAINALKLVLVWLGMWYANSVSAQPPVILVLGDSLSAAYGLAPEQGWVALLQQRLDASNYPHQVVNASISGETTDGGLSRLPDLLRQHRPALVVLELGANDGLRGFPPAQIRANLARLVELALAADAHVLLCGIRMPPNYGPAYTQRFEAVFPAIAEQFAIPLVPRLLAGVGDNLDLMQADGLHPNAAAQTLLLDNVWPGIRAVLDKTPD